MKRIILSLSSLVFGTLLLSAQTSLTANVFWPDGSVYLAPGVMHVKAYDPSNGNILSAFDLPVVDGKANFNFVNPLIETELELRISADLNPRSGVSVLDMVRIQKHLLGIQLLDNALKLVAADANNSESVSALDLVEIRKVILGYYTEWPNKASGTFLERSMDAPPPIGAELKEVITIPFEVLQAGQPVSVRFWAVKTGDIR